MRHLDLCNPYVLMPEQGHGPLPPTHCPGSWIIDGFYTIPGLSVTASGFFSNILQDSCDHSLLWLDFDSDALYGHHIPSFIRQMHNPTVVLDSTIQCIFSLPSGVYRRIYNYQAHSPYITQGAHCQTGSLYGAASKPVSSLQDGHAARSCWVHMARPPNGNNSYLNSTSGRGMGAN